MNRNHILLWFIFFLISQKYKLGCYKLPFGLCKAIQHRFPTAGRAASSSDFGSVSAQGSCGIDPLYRAYKYGIRGIFRKGMPTSKGKKLKEKLENKIVDSCQREKAGFYDASQPQKSVVEKGGMMLSSCHPE